MISCFYIKTLAIVSILFLNICCGNNAEPNKKISNIHDPKINKDSILSDVMDTTAPRVIDLSKARSIEILSISKEMLKGDTAGEYYEKCKSWALTIDEIKNIIQKFRPISSEAQNLFYSYMLCRMTGKIKIDNKEFTYYVNAGSTLTLINENTELYFGCSSKDCKKFFLTGMDDLQEER